MSPRARNTDPSTSHEAAASVTNLTARRAAVLAFFAQRGAMTDVQLAALYEPAAFLGLAPEQSPSGLRTRRSELVTSGRLRDSGGTAVLPSGRRAILWEVAPTIENGDDVVDTLFRNL